ncbi:MAG TPA: dihydroxyacetone kinase subunit DhaL [Candidatus Bathyarchaeia archaeon]|nr:dihydroxyacetone kinase subunit DhaL [Candidatus Bathyarchaeia archaeon]
MDQLAYNDVLRMLRGAAAEVRVNHDTLSKLDSVGGDGDHGTTMLRCIEAIETAIAQAEDRNLAGLLNKAGWAVMGIDGGATGPLFGSFFLGMSEAAEGRDALDAPALADLFQEGLAAIRRRTKAQPGDKTMIDALAPAVDAVKKAAEAGAPPVDALAAAAKAAETGAIATRAMQARFGRAKNIGQKSMGAEDPGAASVACIFKGFYQGATTNA